jgi:WD40 repeat protein
VPAARRSGGRELKSVARRNPYVGPYSFRQEDAPFFFGRDSEAETLTSLAIAERIVLFCAQSGAGKTSLVNARLVPELGRRGFTVLPVARVGAEIPPGMAPANVFTFNVLRYWTGDDGDPANLQPLDLFLRPAVAAGEQEPPRRVLILDQFEEILTSHPQRWQEREGFFSQLRQALRDDPALSVVFVMREEHIAGLEHYAPLLAGLLRSRFRLETLRRADAVAAISRPAAAAGRAFEPEVAERLTDELCKSHVAGLQATYVGESVEPVQLQVVCFRLWESLAGVQGSTITAGDLDKYGNVDRALESFYEEAVAKASRATGVPERRIRLWCETELITPTRVRRQVGREAATAGGLPNEVADALADAHLIRLEAARGGTWYELAHDRFIDPVMRSNRRWIEAGSDPLAAGAKAWLAADRDPSYLYQGQRLKQALQAAGAGAVSLDESERDFLRQSRQQVRRSSFRRWVTGGLALLLGLTIWTAFLARRGGRDSSSRDLARAAQSRAAVEDAELALLLSLAALEQSPTVEAVEALHQALSAASFGGKLRTFKIAADSAAALAFSPDGRRLALVGGDGKVAVLEALSGKPLLTLGGHSAKVSSIAFSRLGQIATADLDGWLIVRDAATGGRPRSWRLDPKGVNSIAFSPDGKLLAAAANSADLTVWNAESAARAWTARTAAAADQVVWDVAFSGDGGILASAGDDGRAILWGAHDGRQLRALEAVAPVTAVALSQDGRVATAEQGGTVKVWRAATGELLVTLRGHQDRVWRVVFSGDGKLLATASSDGTAKLWNVDTGQEIHTFPPGGGQVFPPGGGQVLGVAFSPAPPILLATAARPRQTGRTLDGEATLWTIEDAPALIFRAGPVADVAFRGDGELLAAAAGEMGERDLATGAERRRPWCGAEASFAALSFSPDGRMLACGGTAGALRLWDLGSGRPAPVLAARGEGVGRTGFSVDGRLFAAAAPGGMVRVWSLPAGGAVAAWSPRFQVNALAFDRAGRRLAAAGATAAGAGIAGVWEVASGRSLPAPPPQAEALQAIAFSPDGKRLVTAGNNWRAQLWDAGTGKEMVSFLGHTAGVFGAAFSPDGQRLATAGADGQTRLWDAARGLPLFTLSGHGSGLSGVVFSPDGKRLATASADGTVRLETLDLDELVGLARQRLQLTGRRLTPREREIYLQH